MAQGRRAVTAQRRLVYVSHQLGGYDGVSIEAHKWMVALGALGYAVTAAAGRLVAQNLTGTTPLLLPSLWRPEMASGQLGEAPPLNDSEIAAVIEAAGGSGGHAVLDNVATLPTATDNVLRLVATLGAAGMRMLIRHHDPHWDEVTRRPDERFPIDPEGSRHVAISSHLRDRLRARRGIEAKVCFNTLDMDRLLSEDRVGCRRTLGISARDLVLLHPVTPYPRKAVGVAARFADAVAAAWDGRVVYWLTGGSRDPLAGQGRYAFMTGRRGSPADMYAAADAVLLTSSWEGWGNPAAEGAALGLPVVTGQWPALAEMRRLGLRDIPVSAPDAVARLLSEVSGRAVHRIDELRTALDGSRLAGELEELLSKAHRRPTTQADRPPVPLSRGEELQNHR